MEETKKEQSKIKMNSPDMLGKCLIGFNLSFKKQEIDLLVTKYFLDINSSPPLLLYFSKDIFADQRLKIDS